MSYGVNRYHTNFAAAANSRNHKGITDVYKLKVVESSPESV